MSIVINHVAPGDYDTSNNQFNFTIEAVQPPLVPVSYNASYYYNDYEVYQEWDNDYSTGVYHYRSGYENFYETMTLPVAVTFPVINIQFKITADNVEKVSLSADNIPGYLYDYGQYTIGYASMYLDNNTYFYLESDNFSVCCGSESSYVQVARYGSQYLYFSSAYDKQSGTQSTYGPYEINDPLLGPTQCLGTRLVVQVPEGKYGGDGGIPESSFYRSSDYYPYDYAPDGGYDRGFTRSTYASGYNYGTTDASNP